MRHGPGTEKNLFDGEGNSNMEYEGEWVEDLAHGYGLMKHSNGDTYEGAWEEGKA